MPDKSMLVDFPSMLMKRLTLGGESNSNPWRIFAYKELHAATNRFGEDYKLGEGGFGSVYWGKTSDGLQNAFGKAPDQFATWLNQTSEVTTWKLPGSNLAPPALLQFAKTRLSIERFDPRNRALLQK